MAGLHRCGSSLLSGMLACRRSLPHCDKVPGLLRSHLSQAAATSASNSNPAPAAAAPSTPQTSASVGTMGRALLRLSGYYGSESTGIRGAEALYRACTDAASRKAWHARCNVPEDWQSKHLLRTSYVWLVHKRMKAEGPSCKRLQEQFFDEFWNDTMLRMRNAGIQELLISKNLKMVQEYSFELLLGFDHAMSLPTEQEKLYDLGGAIWGLIYKKPDKFQEEHLMHFATHIFTELETLQEVPSNKFVEGAIEFADAPDFSKPLQGERVPLVYAAPDGCDDVGKWRATLDQGGRMYYWNPGTREATYTKPSFGAASAP